MRHEIRVDKTRDMSCDGCLLTRYFALLSKLVINFSFFILNYFPCYLYIRFAPVTVGCYLFL